MTATYTSHFTSGASVFLLYNENEDLFSADEN